MTTPTTSLRGARWLVGAYTIISVLTVGAIIVLSRIDPPLVNQEAWVRGCIVAATSVLTFTFAHRAFRGSVKALRRLRLAALVITVAVVAVLLIVPLPEWMMIEQAVCGLLLLITAILALRAEIR